MDLGLKGFQGRVDDQGGDFGEEDLVVVLLLLLVDNDELEGVEELGEVKDLGGGEGA